MKRLFLGFCCAALSMPTFVYLVGIVKGGSAHIAFIMTALFTMPLTFFVAVPLYFFARSQITFLRCILFGATIGLFGALIDYYWTRNFLAAKNIAPIMIGFGIVSSAVFWIVGIWKNNNLTKQSSRVGKASFANAENS